jgi:hypothetical protein
LVRLILFGVLAGVLGGCVRGPVTPRARELAFERTFRELDRATGDAAYAVRRVEESFLEWLNERDAIKQGDLLTRFQKQKEDADKALAKLRSRWLDVRLKAKWAFSAWQELLPALPEAEQSEQTARLAALMARWSAAETVLDEDVDDIIARWLDITVTTNDVQRDLARDASGKHRSWAVFFPTQDVKKESATIAEGSVRLGRNTALQFEWSREIDDRVRALTQPPSPPPSVVPSVAVPAVMGP